MSRHVGMVRAKESIPYKYVLDPGGVDISVYASDEGIELCAGSVVLSSMQARILIGLLEEATRLHIARRSNAL